MAMRINAMKIKANIPRRKVNLLLASKLIWIKMKYAKSIDYFPALINVKIHKNNKTSHHLFIDFMIAYIALIEKNCSM